MRVGIFKLVNPPPGQAEIIERAVEAIRYPWWRIVPAIRNDPDGVVLVKWLDTGQGTSGLFYGHNYEIHLSAKVYHLGPQSAFVFAHEVGHLVDRATFDNPTRDAILAKYHADLDGPYDGKVNPNDHSGNPAPFIWSHETPHVERWVNTRNEYQHRPNEAFADSFVAAFAPSIWDGSVMEGASAHYPRFAHWTNDFEGIRRLTLERKIVLYDDVSETNPYFSAIARAAELGLMQGKSATEFAPNEPLTRAQAATVMVRLYDRLKST